jgi:hypothetical protein
MKEKILGYILGVLTYLVQKVLSIDLIFIAVIALSFLVWKGFSWSALSERLIWTGIGTALIAGILVFGQTVGGRQYGIPTYTAAQSSTLIEWNIEIRRQINDRFDFRFRIFLIGAFLFLAGMLVDVLSK